MPFVTYCQHKGCMKEQQPLLDLDTNDVLCGECGKPITTLTSFAKAQLKTLGQTTKRQKTQRAYSVKCGACQRENPPELADDKLVCRHCSKELTGLSKPFELTVRHALKNASKNQ